MTIYVDCIINMKNFTAFLECLEALTVCIGLGENVQMPRKGISHEAITVTRQSCWKPLHRSNNDLNVLNASPLFDSLLTDTAPQVSYEVGDVDFDRGYYLADEIYPSWASFVKEFSSVVDARRKYFTKKQSTARKDVEKTFGILQDRWGILRQPARAYSVNAIKRIMYGCIILHNMIVEDNDFNIAKNKSYYMPVNNLQGSTWYERCDVYAEKSKELRDKDEHEYLRHTLVSHLWHNRDNEIDNEL
ncbi:uncharacterized protein [Rutidosis leptorrhynchoides]|uniref:uncharacterized protein n=1 Tax=Rutidosis leptorrhynchoides TaxID=125765 RepID=UPI003A99CA0D